MEARTDKRLERIDERFEKLEVKFDAKFDRLKRLLITTLIGVIASLALQILKSLSAFQYILTTPGIAFY
ncbi:hypothetical protein L1D34_15200 [Vibrio mediterranei]|uniref:hypothetical protein n=1 Tax=Vibrio mediterranei TaxID=689 RepID=UPI001EFE8D4C|nr:hypothetical protein [Vibrio mediterranei]MCG9626186.1 hypothetical protein [Vibrio mediterranei]